MTQLCKLTDQDGYTRRGRTGETKWSPGFVLETSGEGDLCGPGFVHAYTHPLPAIYLNPIHAGIDNPLLWEADGEIIKSDHGLKVGCTKLTTVRLIDRPEPTTEQTIAFGILCAKEVCHDADWNKWADDWLSGKDRSKAAAAWPGAAARLAAAWAAAAAEAKPLDLIFLAERSLEY